MTSAMAVKHPDEAEGGVRRYWDPVHRMHAVKILPGQFAICEPGEMLVTILGSCVAACIRDPHLGLGGMNHFLLPTAADELNDAVLSRSARYGAFAMEKLLNGLMKRGAQPSRLEIKVCGGGSVVRGMTDVGARNIQFVNAFLDREGFVINAQDVSGPYSRKVYYMPESGVMRVKKIRTSSKDDVLAREERFTRELVQQGGGAGSIELFDTDAETGG